MRLTILLFFLSSLSYAADWNFKGNNRTQDRYLKYLADTCVMASQPIEQCLLNTQLFSNVKVDGNTISVDERWTLIPVPSMSSGSSGSSYGLYLMERNFLGMGKFAMVGGSLGSQGNSLLLFYKDTNFFHSNWTSHVILHAAKSDQKAYLRREVVESFVEDEKYLKLGLGYKLTPKFEVGWGIAYVNSHYQELDARSLPGPVHSLMSSISGEYKGSDFKLYFNEGLDAKIEFLSDVDRSDEKSSVHRVYGDLRYQKNLYLNHAAQFSLSVAGSTTSTMKTIDKVGGKPGLRGIEKGGLWADRYGAFSCDYQFPISELEYGTWTIAPFFDSGIFSSPYTNHINQFQSFGVGGYLFLRQVALPGLGLVVGRNPRFMGNFMTVAIGFQM